MENTRSTSLQIISTDDHRFRELQNCLFSWMVLLFHVAARVCSSWLKIAVCPPVFTTSTTGSDNPVEIAAL